MAMALHQAAAAAAIVLLAGLILSSVPAAEASLPPVSCDAASGSCTVVSAFREWADRQPCKFSQVHYARSESQLVAAVAEAVRGGKKVRVVSKWAHSSPKLLCPAGTDGVLISTRDYNTTVLVDREALKIKEVLEDIRKLVKKRPQAFCEIDGSGFGFLMRFVKGQSSAHLGVAEDALDIDVFFMRADEAETPRLDQDVFDEVEQMLLFKHQGLPHWGKNRPIGFTAVAAKLPRLHEFLKVKAKLDSQGFFSNEWTDAVLGVRGDVTTVKPFCALEGLCVCSKDVHCAPGAGHFCRPGLVYKQARVCRFEKDRKSCDCVRGATTLIYLHPFTIM